LLSIQELRRAAHRAPTTLIAQVRNHRAIVHVTLAAAAMLVALLLSLRGAVAGPAVEPIEPPSILPESIGSGVATTSSVRLRFEDAMDRESVMEALTLQPNSGWRVTWADDSRSLRLTPASRWTTDTRYLVRVGADTLRADGEPLTTTLRWSFTTETAPVVTGFELYYADEDPADRTRARTEAEADQAASSADAFPLMQDTAADVSAATRVTLGFSVPMDQADVETRFAIRPFVSGSFSWESNSLVFVPNVRLESGARYAVSVIGAHDSRGNRLAGDASFSFTVRDGGQVVIVRPKDGEKDVTAGKVQLWFSEPMDVAATTPTFTLTDATTEKSVAGTVSWNPSGTQLTFTPKAALAKGHRFTIDVGDGARDMDRNAVTASFKFTTKAAPVAQSRTSTAPIRTSGGPPAPSDMIQYALWQINQSRAAYGFAPLVLDATITQEATAYAWDMMNYGYFSHVGRDGSRIADRLRRAGVSFSWSGENICYLSGQSLKSTLNWCHSVFMSEPYPGYANHIGNILSANYRRVGIGIAQSGGRIKIVWDFAG
jgi:uncharacterized protein YkwD